VDRGGFGSAARDRQVYWLPETAAARVTRQWSDTHQHRPARL